MNAPSRGSLWILVAVAIVGHVLLAAGLFGPAITIAPRMGEFTTVAAALGILDRGETLSIVASTRRLFDAGETVIAIVIALASIVTPLTKLAIINRALVDALRSQPVTPWLARTSNLTKYSLIDVLVIAILIVCAKSFPGGTVITPRWGIYAFSAAAILPWIIARGLAPSRKQAARAAASEPA
jgi:Paraquat-inducible protein A